MQCHQCFEEVTNPEWFLYSSITRLCPHCIAWLGAGSYSAVGGVDSKGFPFAPTKENYDLIQFGAEMGNLLRDRHPIVVAATLLAERRGWCGEAV